MASFCLHLTSSNRGISLEATEFKDPETSAITRCQRGANTFRKGLGTFPWSQGVQALVRFFIEVKIAELESSQGSIHGEQGSLAASLDYSIAKNGQWLADMFGAYSDGTLRARRIILRNNPERKRPGPVEIFLNSKLLPPHDVSIYFERKLVQSKDQLQQLRTMLSAGSVDRRPRNSDICRQRPSSANQDLCEPARAPGLLCRAFEDEINFGLRSIPIYNRDTSQQVIKKVFENPSVQGLGCPTSMLNDFIEPQLSDRFLLGLSGLDECELLVRRLESAKIALSASEFGAIGLFSALIRKYGLELNLDYSYPHAGDLLDTILNGPEEPPLLCVVALAATDMCWTGKFASLYRPVMFMPDSSKKVLERSRAHKRPTRSFSYCFRDASSAAFYFDDLKRAGFTGKTLQTSSMLYFAEAMRLLRDGAGEARAILWFPFHNFNIWLNECSEVQVPVLRHRHPLNSVLFIRRGPLKSDQTGRAVAALIRNLWLELMEKPSLVSQLAHSLVDKADYVRMLGRMGGINPEVLRTF